MSLHRLRVLSVVSCIFKSGGNIILLTFTRLCTVSPFAHQNLVLQDM